MTPALRAKLDQARRELHAGDVEKARATLQRLAAQHPGAPEPSLALAIVLARTDRHEQAVFFARRASELSPESVGVLLEAANVLLIARDFASAARLYGRALTLGAIAEGEHGLANALLEQERFGEALSHARRAHALRPRDPAVLAVLASLLNIHGLADEALPLLEDAMRDAPDAALAPLAAFISNYAPGANPQARFVAHRRHGQLLQRSHPRSTEPFANTPDPSRPVRVGLLSHELRRHPVAVFLEPWLAHRDARVVDLVVYSTSRLTDGVTERLRSLCPQWRSLAGVADRDAERRIRADGIDVLLDTSGITTGNRAELLARGPAPVQATYLGYPGTSGLSTVDFRIADPITEPPEADRFSTERLVRLDPTFLCFSAAPEPALSPPPCLAGAPFTFGSFNASQKINPIVVDTWSRILAGVPGSRLLLKTVHLADVGLREYFRTQFVDRGIDPARLDIAHPTASTQEHLARYARVDVALDTFPYNGTTTTLEALWMGVPVVCLAGEGHPGRVGEAILRALGAPQWLTPDPDAYVRLALGLAHDPHALTPLRSPGPAGLRARLLASPLMDASRHAAAMDAALAAMWRDWCGRGAGAPAS